MNKDEQYLSEAYDRVYLKEEEELGPDPKEADELEAIMKQHKPDYQHTPFWDAYKAVKDGLWSEDEFHQWAQTVWNAGAEESQQH